MGIHKKYQGQAYSFPSPYKHFKYHHRHCWCGYKGNLLHIPDFFFLVRPREYANYKSERTPFMSLRCRTPMKSTAFDHSPTLIPHQPT